MTQNQGPDAEGVAERKQPYLVSRKGGVWHQCQLWVP